MRFYESHGKTTETDINISPDLLQIENIWECDLMENKNTLFSLSEDNLNSLRITFQPYEIKTFLI